MAGNLKQLLWKLSLGLCSIYGPENDIETIQNYKDFWGRVSKNEILPTRDLLCGIPETSSEFVLWLYKERVESFLERFFLIHGESDLKERLEELLKGGPFRTVFDTKRHLLMSMPYEERLRFISSFPENSDEHARYSIINQYHKSLPPAGILAFEISNYVNICRLGVYLDYLQVDELEFHLNQAAALAKRNYENFGNFALSSAVGTLFKYGNMSGIISPDLYNNLQTALTNPLSHWRNMDWNLELDLIEAESIP
jgi:hypothetical protein